MGLLKKFIRLKFDLPQEIMVSLIFFYDGCISYYTVPVCISVKLIANKCISSLQIDIFQRRESLADEYTLLDIAYIYPWKRVS